MSRSKKNKGIKFGATCLVFLTAAGWIFSGWPRIFDFPPEIQEARANTTNLVVTSCDISDVSDTTCYDAIIADDGSSDTLSTKTEHLDAPFQTLSADSVNSAALYYDSWGVMDTNEDWGIYVKDARDGTTICSVDPAPEYASETTDSFDCSAITAAQLSAGVWLYIAGSDAKGPNPNNIEYIRLYADYNPPSGTLTADIVDASYVSVSSPTVAMNATTFDFACQTVTGSFGTASQQIYVNNDNGGSGGWTLTLAAQNTTDVWDSAGTDYDFNDPTSSGCTDDGDADSLGGQMTIDASGATLAVGQCGGCTTNNISKGSSASYIEGTTDTVTLLTATAASDDVGDWTLQGVSISQKIPAEQPAASDYSINMVLTVTAS